MSSLELTVVRLELFTKLLTPQVFACQVLAYLVSHVFIFRQAKELM